MGLFWPGVLISAYHANLCSNIFVNGKNLLPSCRLVELPKSHGTHFLFWVLASCLAFGGRRMFLHHCHACSIIERENPSSLKKLYIFCNKGEWKWV